MADIQEQVRLREARNFGRMLAEFWEMSPEKRIAVLVACQDFPTHPDIADNEQAIRTIAEAFWPDMASE